MDYIRSQVAHLHGDRVGRSVRVLYGGSVDDTTARGYLEIDDCDGVLVGGASINPYKFSGIVEAAHRLQTEVEHEG